MQSEQVLTDLGLEHEMLRETMAALEKQNLEEERECRELERRGAEEEGLLRQFEEEERAEIDEKEGLMKRFEKEMDENIIKAKLLTEEHARVDQVIAQRDLELCKARAEVEQYKRSIEECEQTERELQREIQEITRKKDGAVRFLTQSEGALQ